MICLSLMITSWLLFHMICGYRMTKIFLQKTYICIISLFVFLLYPVRVLSLLIDQNSFVFQSYGFRIVWDNINFFILFFIIIFFYLLSFFIPKVIEFSITNRKKNILIFIFLIQCILSIFNSMTGARMGNDISAFQKVLGGLVYSIIPIDFFFMTVLIIEKKTLKRSLFILFYIMTFFVIGSKSGIFNVILILFFVKISLGTKILFKRYLLIFSLTALSYPFLAVVSGFVRMGGQMNVQVLLENSSQLINEHGIELLRYSLISLSRRLSGIDILMIPKMNNETFSSLNILLYSIKGLIPAGIIDFVMNKSTYSLGREFSIEFLKQDPNFVNAYGVSFIGTVLFSNSPFFVCIYLFLLLFLIIIILNKFRKNDFVVYLYIYFIIQFPLNVLMSGSPINITIIFRYLFYLFVLDFFIKNVFVVKQIKVSSELMVGTQ